MPKKKKAKELQGKTYEDFKGRRQHIDLDFLKGLSEFRTTSPFLGADEIISQYQNYGNQEARFREARMQALRAFFDLPRKTGKMQVYSPEEQLLQEGYPVPRRYRSNSYF